MSIQLTSIVFFLLVFLQLFNTYYVSWILSLAAIREYFLAIPMLYAGWWVYFNWTPIQWQKSAKFILVAVTITILGSGRRVDHTRDATGQSGECLTYAH